MTNYHLSIDGPRICKADKQDCPVKNEDGTPVEHFGSKKEAEQSYDKKLKKEYSTISQPFKKMFSAKHPNINERIEKLDNEYERLSAQVVEVDPETKLKEESEDFAKVANIFTAKDEDWNAVIIPSHGSVKVPKLSKEEIESFALLQEYDSYMRSALDAKSAVKFHVGDDNYDVSDIYEQGYIIGLEKGMEKIKETLKQKKYSKIDMDDVEKRVQFYHKAVITGRAKNADEKARSYDSVVNEIKKTVETEIQQEIDKDIKTMPKGYYKEGLRDFSSWNLNSKGVVVTTLPDGTHIKGNGALERAAAAQNHIRYISDVNALSNN